MIHPTAVIDPSARLGENVEVGAYSVIGRGVSLGDGCVLANHVSIAGPTSIGSGNHFFPFCSIGQRSQDLKYEGEPTFLEIGNKNSFREFCTVNRGTAQNSRTLIGHENNFLAYAHVAHDCTVGNHTIFSNNGTIAGHVIVEDYAVIGGLSGVHQFCRIGTHAILGGCTKIVQDVVPYMIADGNPAELRGLNQIGLERRGFSTEDLRTLREAYRLLCRSKLNVKQAVEAMRKDLTDSPHLQHLLSFIESSKRGVVRS
jgi:UDP-N-acetylglucosamine acyltransferase